MIKEYLEEVKESKVADSWDDLPDESKSIIPTLLVGNYSVNLDLLKPEYVALIKLEDLRNETWRRCDDWKPDRNEDDFKRIILSNHNKIETSVSKHISDFLAFPT